MPKVVCHRCRKSVQDHDFYIESRGGPICSSCILAAEERSVQPATLQKNNTETQIFGPLAAWADASK
ncbi:MAG: hypothetical protein PWQ57_1835 [Desulfovibrionales bacterium]|jgi:hypothetical protein|nr:hypothetical protein [Desulfovibrionales bacterium]